MIVGHVEGRGDKVVDLYIVVDSGHVLFLVPSIVESILIGVAEHCAGLDNLVTVADGKTMLVLRSPFFNHEGVPVGNRVCVRIELMILHIVENIILVILEILLSFGVAGIIPLGLILELHESHSVNLLWSGCTEVHGVAAVVVD